MLSRPAKAAFYAAAGPMMRANGAIYKSLRAPKKPIKAQLGPGQQRYLSGWTNVDANMFTGKCDVWADLRNPLPFRDGTLSACYSHHVIEHLPDLKAHFAEVLRCLAPGAVYRVGGPNGDTAIRKFIENDINWFGNWPDDRRSIGGRFENFIFCRREHLTILTYSFISELMEDAGFTDIVKRLPVKDTGFLELFQDAMQLEAELDFENPRTLIVEAVKAKGRRL